MENMFDKRIVERLYKPREGSHKGENGRLLVIGGSKLFHTSIFWSADVASKIVDLVHFTSPASENRELIRRKLKEGFWNGIVVDFAEVEDYINEDDCVLIGPGMVRADSVQASRYRRQASKLMGAGERDDNAQATSDKRQATGLEDAGKRDDTEVIVNTLLKKYPEKKWVIDGGALQECDPGLLNGNMIITPHQGEWDILMQKSKLKIQNDNSKSKMEEVVRFSKTHDGVTVLLKGKEDIVCQGEEWVVVPGGNPGMTKGGTGDVLAGLVAALYCKNEAFVAAQVGSWVNKKAGEALAERQGVYYNAADLVQEVPKALAELVGGGR